MTDSHTALLMIGAVLSVALSALAIVSIIRNGGRRDERADIAQAQLKEVSRKVDVGFEQVRGDLKELTEQVTRSDEQIKGIAIRVGILERRTPKECR